MTQRNRLAGGLIDRSHTIEFSFDGKRYTGHAGDTLASALLANGVRLVGRSFKYHRPRGIWSAGSEEPNALVQLRTGARNEPNTRATTVELFDGLEAHSQNRWPSLAFDVLGINDFLSPFLAAGFYYKTFMWPRSFWEKVYEPAIRRAAGLGRLADAPDPDLYDRGYLHADLLVIGAGPAGLAAALTAGRAGARVILADEDFQFGGRLNAERISLNGEPAATWVAAVLAELATLPNVRLMKRTTVFGVFDHGIYGALERDADHLHTPLEGKPRQTFWRIYTQRAVVCAGATERSIAFSNNDRPGIMLAGAVRAYANRWAVAADRKVAIFTNNDTGHQTAADLARLGVEVVALIDSRSDAPDCAGVEVLKGAVVVNSTGRMGLKSVTVQLANGRQRTIACGALGVSGGWNPNVQLTAHHACKPVWNEGIAAFVPGERLPAGMSVAGSAAGLIATADVLRSGAQAAVEALESLGLSATPCELPDASDSTPKLTPLWHVPGKGRAWVDLQHDVTMKDVALAHRENFRSVEHLKRYTTLGMATDQGRTSNLTGLAAMAELTGRSIAQTGTTMYRPPYTPVSLGALAGRSTGKGFRPYRLVPSHHWAVEHGAVFVETGNWLRAQYFPRSGETHWRQSVDREVLAVRRSVGLCDVTTLGKVDVQGSDAGEFLNRIYCNMMGTLAVGRVRYGLMLREDGFAQDDGTAARLAEDHYVVTTTTANAVAIFRHMEFCRQCLWPDLDVQLVSTTDAWAQYAIAGPNARRLLQKVVDAPYDISNDAFPFMACAELTICQEVRARLFRISFSGELAYELAVPARYGDSLMRVLMEAGKEFDVTPYGTEALGVLRIEKGHAAGPELNGQTSGIHLGLGRMVSRKKDSIGAVMSRRMALEDADGHRMVGLLPVDGESALPAGAHLFDEQAPQNMSNDLGWVSSAAWSPHVGGPIALAFLKRGEQRMGDIVCVASPVDGVNVRARVTSPVFIDPEGERLRV